MPNVLIVENHHVLRKNIEALIQRTTDIRIVGIAQDKIDAIYQIETNMPDVALMAVDLIQTDELEVATFIKEYHPQVKVVLLTVDFEEDLVIRALQVGVDGILLKHSYADNLLPAIRDVARGSYVLSGDIAKIIVNKINGVATKSRKQRLAKALKDQGMHFTKKNLNVAYLIMEGYTNAEIARELHITDSTIKNYVSDLYSIICIRNRGAAITFFRNLMKGQTGNLRQNVEL